MDVAGRLFAEHGYHGTSIRMLADACGLRSASLYSHFAGKEQLFVEVVDRYFRAYLPALTDASKADGTGADRLASMIDVSVEVATAHRDAFLALTNDWSLIRRNEQLADLLAGRNDANECWATVLEAGVADGSLRADVEPGAALWILYSAIVGMIGERHGDGRGVPAVPSTPTLVRVLLGGLATD